MRQHNFNMETSGILRFQPPTVTKKHKRQAEWKRTAIVELDPEISRYYAWFIRKRYNIPLAIPFRDTHLTIINDRVESEVDFLHTQTQLDGKRLHVKFATDVRTDGLHWWLPAECEEAYDIREKAGLSRIPYYGLHITIGNVYERYIEHSHYIKKLIDEFGGTYR